MRNVLLALVLLAAPAAASAQRYAPYQSSPRDTWYIGFGVGPGAGSYTFEGERVNFRDHHGGLSATQVAFQLELGATVSPQLLVGGELSALVSSADEAGVESTLSVAQLLAVLTFFPNGQGFFLRGGAGLAGIESTFDDGLVRVEDDASGLGLLGGVGYAFWLGHRFNLTLHADVNHNIYSESSGPDSSTAVTGYLGFRWY